MANCILKVACTQAGYLVRIEGRGTAQESPTVAAFVCQYLKSQRPASVTLDLSSCTYLDSTFLGCLLTLHRECLGKSDAQFLVVANEETRKKLLSLTRLDTVFDFAESEPVTQGGFTQLVSTKLGASEFGHHVVESHRALAGVPSPSAGLFREIADKLARELEDRQRHPDRPAGLRETV